MATPSASEHRDLEQKLRNLKEQLSNLATAVMKQRQLGVTDGDFVVSGGGGITIKNGGTLTSEHPNGQTGLEFGPVTPAVDYDHGLTIRTDDGLVRAFFAQVDGGSFDVGIGSPNRARNIEIRASDTLEITSGGGILIAPTNDDPVTLGAGSSPVYITAATTGSAANTRLDVTTGEVLRVTSSLRYKQDVQPAEVDPAAVLSLSGRTWRGRDDVADRGEGAAVNVGFIAEELHDAGLGLFVEYDDQGRPDAIQYDRLSVALLEVAKSQADQIAALDVRLTALENAG